MLDLTTHFIHTFIHKYIDTNWLYGKRSDTQMMTSICDSTDTCTQAHDERLQSITHTNKLYIQMCIWTYPLAAPQNTHHRHKWFHKFVCRKIARDECRSIFQFDAINEMEVLNVYSFVCFILFFRIISTIKSCNIDAFLWSASEASKQKMKWNDYKQAWEWWKKIICPIRMRYLQSIYFSALSLIQFSSKMKCCVYEWVSEWMSDSMCSFFVVLRKRWDASSMHVCVNTLDTYLFSV